MMSQNQKVRQYVLGELESGRLEPGAPLTGSRQLSELLGVSRLIVQSAISTLVNEGVLTSRPRRGVFAAQEWESRILPSTLRLYIDGSYLPWKVFLRNTLEEKLPELHLSSRMQKGLFEILPTAIVQSHQREFMDLSEMVANVFPDLAPYNAKALDAFRFGKRLVGLPFLYSPRVVFINREMFARLGVPLPEDHWSYDDFLRLVAHAKTYFSPDQIFCWRPWMLLWINFILRCGGTLIEPDAEDPIRVDSPETVRGLSIYRQLRDLLGTKNLTVPQKVFDGGDLLISIETRQAAGRIRQKGAIAFHVLPLPAFPRGFPGSMQATELLCVRNECIDRRSAETLMRLLWSEDFQDHIGNLGYGIPVRKSSAERSLAGDSGENRIFLQESRRMISRYHLDSPELYRIVSSGVNRILSENLPVAEECAALGRTLRSIIHFTGKELL